MPYDAVSDASDKHIGSAGLTMAAHDNEIRKPIFSPTQNQCLRRSIINDEFKLALRSSGDFSNTRGCGISYLCDF